jgi:hypothetical protein
LETIKVVPLHKRMVLHKKNETSLLEPLESL